ncbi:MAG: hypothetical protein ACRDWN_07600 [Acidimicrobiales bacterium]
MMATSAPLVAVEILAACIWVGSIVCLIVVTGAARQVLDGRTQVAFFRAVGRRYAVVGTLSLVVAIGAGLALSWPPSSWSSTADAATALAGVLVLATAASMVQARTMTRLGRRAVGTPEDDGARRAVRRGRKVATALRSLMGAVTFAIVLLAAAAIAH